MTFISHQPVRKIMFKNKALFLIFTLGSAFAYAQSQALSQAQTAYEQGNKVQAFKYLQQGASEGDKIAQYNLSISYSNGEGTAKDEKKALQWLEKSAQQGYEPAQYDLGLYYLQKKQFAKAAPWLERSSFQGNPIAQFNYAMMLLKGDGVKKDVELAKQWLEQSVKSGFPPAVEALQKLQK